jgi:hypothetical protein
MPARRRLREFELSLEPAQARGAGGREGERHRRSGSHHARLESHVADVDEHAIQQFRLCIGPPIAGERDFVLASAIDIFENAFGEAPACDLAQIGDVVAAIESPHASSSSSDLNGLPLLLVARAAHAKSSPSRGCPNARCEFERRRH